MKNRKNLLDGSKVGVDDGLEEGFELFTREGFDDAVTLGEKLGKRVGTTINEGLPLGQSLGSPTAIDGESDGLLLGLPDFDTDGTALGTSLGEDDATIVGTLLG